MAMPRSSRDNADERNLSPWRSPAPTVRRRVSAVQPHPSAGFRPLPPHAMIPVAIVTGFLGSGKTTLISRILRDPAFARTAVIVNEFGEIGLDHELIASSDETLLALTTGCLCCAVRSDLVATLLDLQRRREVGEIGYERVLIETSGLADPAPILHALMTDRDLATDHVIDGVTTVVDTLHGEATLDRSPEARRQA